MQINFPFSKKVRVIDTDTIPVDLLELIIRRGVLEMARDASTKDLIRQHSHFVTKKRPIPVDEISDDLYEAALNEGLKGTGLKVEGTKIVKIG
jgi:hypothetical protein